MRSVIIIASSCLLLLAACESSSDGYYDAEGRYHSYNSDYNKHYARDYGQPTTPAVAGGGEPAYTTRVTTTTTYKRPGYYDYNGYYIARDSGPSVPADYFPPRGMCRVWFTDRPVEGQPIIEHCDGIQDRVPAGAYVIYGG